MRMIPAREDLDGYATLKPQPGADNLQWVAVEETKPGKVMVIDSRNDPRAASMGNMLPTRMQKRGVVGVILGDSGGMTGSVAIVDFDSRAEVDAWLSREPYVTQGVWQRIDITEIRVAVRSSQT